MYPCIYSVGYAVDYNCIESLQVLIDVGTDVNEERDPKIRKSLDAFFSDDRPLTTPLEEAINSSEGRESKVVEVLLNAGARITFGALCVMIYYYKHAAGASDNVLQKINENNNYHTRGGLLTAVMNNDIYTVVTLLNRGAIICIETLECIATRKCTTDIQNIILGHIQSL